MTADFKPFLISKLKTGLFQYLQPWVSPEESFVQLQDANVFRGTLQRRNGCSFFGSLQYKDIIGVGDGGKNYSGTLVLKPIVAGTFTPSDGIESFTDDGLDVLTGNMGGSGTIDYTTGAWTLTFGSPVAARTLIYWIYTPNVDTDINYRPIMGLPDWTNEATDIITNLAIDTRRAAVYNIASGKYVFLDTVSQTLLVSTGTATPIAVSSNTGWAAVSPYTTGLQPFSISITDGVSTIVDDGAGNLSASGDFAAGGTVNYSTGLISFTYNNTAIKTITLSATLTGDYFSGDFTNFFNFVNWEQLLFLTNNKDPITTFDGTKLSRQAFFFDATSKGVGTNNIASCLDVNVYENRLLVIFPTIVLSTPSSNNGFFPQRVIWSGLNAGAVSFSPFDLSQGGFLDAATDDFIRSDKFLRDQLYFQFSNSIWAFRFTGSTANPFAWVKLNSSKSTNAPYGSIPFDDKITSMGSKGLIAFDGANTQRYDLNVIDEFLNRIDQKFFSQCFGLRFDPLNQAWMLFPSQESTGPSDSVIIYNFLENTWANYSFASTDLDFPGGMSCLGTFYSVADAIWTDFASPSGKYVEQFPNWQSADIPWNNYLLQSFTPILLGGGNDGNVYLMDFGNQDFENTEFPVSIAQEVVATVQTVRLNPFSTVGEKVQFGYIDFYYEINPEVVLTLNFAVSNNEGVTFQRTLTLDGEASADNAMKRIYINSVGEFLQMTITDNGTESWKILGLVLWARPAGRFTP